MALFFTVLLSIAAGFLVYYIANADQAEAEQVKLMGIISILLMLIVVLVSFFISVFVVRRINIIAETAKNIMDTGDLSRRISIDSRWDDLSNLAGILNALLDRIEFLMEGVRRVSDNIAHDLRTPLTRLRNQLETLKKEGASQYSADHLIAEADQLLRTFNALLRIANIESGKRHQQFADIPIHALLEDVIELYAPLAEEKNIVIKSALVEATCAGDRDLLFQTFANLLDNAIKFTPEQGKVAVNLALKDARPHVVITDTGPGIVAEEKEKVFDRFYRSEQSRHSPGSGLGLSLVSAVIELHKGEIALFDNAPGLRVEITL